MEVSKKFKKELIRAAGYGKPHVDKPESFEIFESVNEFIEYFVREGKANFVENIEEEALEARKALEETGAWWEVSVVKWDEEHTYVLEYCGA